MDLVQQVQVAFGSEGVLSRAAEQFKPRDGQREMALAVARAIQEAGTLVVEASTGVGKTFSYLVPALLSGERVMVSTATKALQDQLYGRDLPRLVAALGLPVSTALLKGRGSYLCIHRMQQARSSEASSERALAMALSRVEQWAQATTTGDLAELPGLDERSPIIPLVTSTRENCLGSVCPSFKACHVSHARREALAADVVVINHHLFFADLAVRESGMAELLPTVRVAIFDEAHQLNETGIQFLGRNLSTAQLLDLSHDVLATGLQLARGLVDWQAVAARLERAARELRLCIGRAPAGARLRWTEAVPEGLDSAEWTEALDQASQAAEATAQALDSVTELAPDFVRLHERARQFADSLAHFSGQGLPEAVRWLEVGLQAKLVESPLDIAQAVSDRLLGPAQAGKTWVFTSATLGDDERLSWFTQPCGLQGAEVLRIGSPFDYASQAALYVPRDFPKPSDPAHSQRVAQAAGDWAQRLGGRTLVLTTTLKALRVIAEALQARFSGSGQLEVLVQGQGPKGMLIERFRRASSLGEPGCVLVASASFWEGIDVAGDALQMVIIDKLPFPPPGDPLAEARSRHLESQGRSAFNDYFVPEAAVSLKQGAGRLIRRETDQGVLIICDTRLVQMGYGRRLLKALPPMQRLQTEDELRARLDQLTKAGTTDAFGP